MASETHVWGAICGPAMVEYWRKPYGERWCFTCRKRRQFENVRDIPFVPENPTIDDMPWYGPTDHIECSVCKTWDGDCFPGTSREWE
jgi:hypothetical protein